MQNNKSNNRRSRRLQSQENTESAAGSVSPKKKKNQRDSDSHFSFQHDAIREEIENIDIEQNKERPTELFTENDVDASQYLPLVGTPMKKNGMMEKATTCWNQQNLPKLYVPVDRIDPKINVKDSLNNVQESSPSISRRLRPRAPKDFHLKTDEYFATQSEKCITSNNTLSKLRKKHVAVDLEKSPYISNSHQKHIQVMTKKLQSHYTEWLHIMEEGFTILLYGLGSKRLLINDFHKQKLSDEPALIINGFFPSLTLKEILDGIIVDLLGLETVTNLSECYEIIEKTMETYSTDRIYLLIHNIDGGMLRANKIQDMLSRLASIPNIHVIASVDHINAPLIWDNVKRARYNFYWMEATTFLPYEAETSYESSLLVQKSGALALLSLQNVFASLTANAKAIYILLVKYQLTNSGSTYAGMAFKDLYRACREAFLVSSDQALRSQLTEFLDHKLVRTKRNIDGVEYLIIPLDNALLKQFLEQQDNAL